MQKKKLPKRRRKPISRSVNHGNIEEGGKVTPEEAIRIMSYDLPTGRPEIEFTNVSPPPGKKKKAA